jgi:hypothetical protein
MAPGGEILNRRAVLEYREYIDYLEYMENLRSTKIRLKDNSYNELPA